MCQAYEGERASIVASERIAMRKGYEAAKKGEPKANPYDWDMYRRDAWNLGYDCFTEEITPWFMKGGEKE